MTPRRVGLQPHAVDEAELRAAERVIADTKQTGEKKSKEKAPPPWAVRIDPAVVEDVRNADVYLTMLANAAASGLTDKPAPTTVLGMSGLVEAALKRELARLSKRYNDGKPFPRRVTEPRRGRRVG